MTEESHISITNQYSSFFNINYYERKTRLGNGEIDFKPEKNSSKALEFLYRPSNPCFIQSTGMFDIMYYQWIYKAALLLLKTELEKDELLGLEEDPVLKKLIIDYRDVASKWSASIDYFIQNINARDCNKYPVGSMPDDKQHISQIIAGEIETPKIINKMLSHYCKLKSKNDLTFQVVIK
jgi:hypothetical protein